MFLIESLEGVSPKELIVVFQILFTIPFIVASGEIIFLKLIDKNLPLINHVTGEIKWINYLLSTLSVPILLSLVLS